MNRTQKVRELMEGMHLLQQKMVEKKAITANISKITFSQLRVLDIINRRGYATTKEIHTTLGITSSAVTQIINELVKRGHVVRESHAHDRRASSIVLSTKTKESIQKIMRYNIAKMEKWFEALSDKEFETYIHLNTKIITSATK